LLHAALIPGTLRSVCTAGGSKGACFLTLFFSAVSPCFGVNPEPAAKGQFDQVCRRPRASRRFIHSSCSMVIKLLMIDTDESFCQNVSQRLRMEDYQVFLAADEAEAKRIVLREKIDVVLLGLKGLKQRGVALLKTIKTMRPVTEVILMLPAEQLSLSIEGMRLGAFDDLLMPFDIETLLARIKAAYRHRQEQEQAQKSLPHKQRRRLAAGSTETAKSESGRAASEGKKESASGAGDDEKA